MLLSLVAWVINKIVQISVPAIMNRTLGAGFGIIRGVLICTFSLYILRDLISAEIQVEKATLSPYFLWIIDWMAEVVPQIPLV